MRRRKWCKIALLVLLLPIVALPFTVKGANAEENRYEIDEYFPSEELSAYFSMYDVNSDGALDEDEIREITSLNLEGCSASDIPGVELLSSLQMLSIDGGEVKELNFSSFPELSQLAVFNTGIENLSLTANPLLTSLTCAGNDSLTSIDISKCPKLATLNCDNSALGYIDVRNNPLLDEALIDYMSEISYKDYILWTNVFEYWYSDGFIIYPIYTAVRTTESPESCTLTFMSDSGVYTTETASFASAVTAPKTPEKAEAVFEGWYLDEEGYYPFDFSLPVVQDLIVYAKWNKLYNLKGFDVSLSDTISLTAYYDVEFQDVWNHLIGAEVTYPDGHTERIPFAWNNSYHTENGETYYGITCNLPAKEINSEISIQLFRSDVSCSAKESYSVQEYCENLMLDGETGRYAEAVRNTAEQLVTYGEYSKAYFDEKEGKLVEDVTREISEKDEVVEKLEEEASLFIDGVLPDGIQFVGVSLTLESSIGLTAYFEADSDVASKYRLHYSKTKQLYYLHGEQVAISDMGQAVTFYLGNATIQCSPLMYLYMALNQENAPGLANLCVALWDYYEATQEMIEADPANIPAEEPEPGSVRDLKGLEVALVDWWSDDNWNEPANAYDEAYWDMIEQKQAEHNFTLTRKNIGGWGNEYTERVMESIANNDPIGSLIVFDNTWVASYLTNGAFLDVSKLPSIDWTDEKWNHTAVDVMSINGGIYGFAADFEPRTGVFFNKALFTQLGIDPELPYNLQAEGKWNWEEFEKLCKALTVDTDNDGDTDVYGVTGQNTVFFSAALLSNGTHVITKEESGKLVMNADDPKVLEALNWGHGLLEKGYFRLPSAEDMWDYYKADFFEGTVAMWVEEEYAISKGINDHEMNVGFVTFPYGPSLGHPMAICRENIWVMPNCPSVQQVADDIAYAYNIYTDVPEGYEEDDTRWKASYETQFGDTRAVNETINFILNEYDSYMSADMLIPGFRPDWLYMLGEKDAVPSDILDMYSDEWQSQVDEFNAAW